ncbi:hypothetical protein [Ilumatobacter sp.]|uniref:hypothetical protein n=1 Tax=Ilumatobacter sp. TaxID=1967498 RepID=UPI003B52969B
MCSAPPGLLVAGARARTTPMSAPGPRPWWRAVLAYPPTWIAAGVLAVAVWALVALLRPPGALIAAVVVVAVAAAVAWPVTMSATGTLADLQFAIPRVRDIDPAELDALAAELATLDDPQPAEQLAALRHKRAALVAVLDRRLDAGELTYSRYLATAQQVCDAALDNLREVAVASAGVRSIDQTYIDRRLAELSAGSVDHEAAGRERSTLERRAEMRTSQQARIARFMAQNEAALTSLDRTTTALADVPIGKHPSDADAAMDALEELADRASMYADDPTKGSP